MTLKEGARPFDHLFADDAITVLLGRNLAGKTRLARLIAGLESPRTGSILIDGADVTTVPAGERSAALVYQNFVNYPEWTVFQNIASPMLGRGVANSAVREQVQDIARQLQLAELLDRLPGSLSGGQQQRLAIGRALAKQARVLVLDEPLVNLDYKLREALTVQLQSLFSGAGVSVIYTSSDPRDAFALGDEVLLLEEHEVVQSGSPISVYERPCSPAAMDLMSDPGANRWQGETSALMVRPEHLALEAQHPDDRSFEATVLSSETNGAETYLHCQVNGGHWVAKLDGLVHVEADACVQLFAAPDAVVEFDREHPGG